MPDTPRLIKRYANRKLYDTRAKKYITLDGVSRILSEGGQIQVIDRDTGEDLTSVTLSQIVLDLARHKDRPLPTNLMADIVCHGRKAIEDLKSRVSTWKEMAPISEEDIRRAIQPLVDAGELGRTQARALQQRLTEHAQTSWVRVERAVDHRVRAILQRFGLASQEDLERLSTAMTTLQDKIDLAAVPRKVKARRKGAPKARRSAAKPGARRAAAKPRAKKKA